MTEDDILELTASFINVEYELIDETLGPIIQSLRDHPDWTTSKIQAALSYASHISMLCRAGSVDLDSITQTLAFCLLKLATIEDDKKNKKKNKKKR